MERCCSEGQNFPPLEEVQCLDEEEDRISPHLTNRSTINQDTA